MGLYDTVIVLDDVRELSCAHGHALRSFQTKDLKQALANRGVYVLRDDEPLGMAHLEIARARQRANQRRPRRG